MGREPGTYLVRGGVDIDDELAVDEAAAQWHERVLVVREVDARDLAVRVVPIDLRARKSEERAVSRGCAGGRETRRTMKVVWSFVSRLVTTRNSTRMPSDFSQTQ